MLRAPVRAASSSGAIKEAMCSFGACAVFVPVRRRRVRRSVAVLAGEQRGIDQFGNEPAVRVRPAKHRCQVLGEIGAVNRMSGWWSLPSAAAGWVLSRRDCLLYIGHVSRSFLRRLALVHLVRTSRPRCFPEISARALS